MSSVHSTLGPHPALTVAFCSVLWLSIQQTQWTVVVSRLRVVRAWGARTLHLEGLSAFKVPYVQLICI